MNHLPIGWVGERESLHELACVDAELVQHDHALSVAAPPAPALDLEDLILDLRLQTAWASQVHDGAP
jgi:hypothetical protein